MLITFNDVINYAELRKRHNLLNDELVTIQVGSDGKIYFLFNDNVPDRIDGMFVPTKSNSGYSVLVLDVDWNRETVTCEKLYRLGILKMNYHYLQPIEDKLLLVASRCLFNEGDPEKNAAIVDFEGNIHSEFCLGDGINDCLVRKDNTIVISYFDEGIFGNYGWDEPLGACGIKVWSKDGKDVIWESDRDIYDCYAFNISEQGDIWYYYYDDFKLIHTNMKEEVEYNPNINGADAFIIFGDGHRIIMNSGYDRYNEFSVFQIREEALTEPERVCFQYGRKPLDVRLFCAYGEKAIFTGEGTKLYIKRFTEI